MTKRKTSVGTKVVNRRAVLQSLAVGLGALGVGRSLFACGEPENSAPQGGFPTTPGPSATTVPTDGDEFVPGEGTPIDTGDKPPTVPNPAWEARAKQLESEQARLFRAETFTQASPGQMAGKERSHVPSATVGADGGLKRVTVVVQHVMGMNLLDAGTLYDAGDAATDASLDAGPDARADGGDAGAKVDGGDAGAKVDAGGTPPPAHYITTIYLRALVGEVDTVVGLYEFASTDAAPPTVRFTLPAGVTSVTAFEWCTLHGLWASTPMPV